MVQEKERELNDLLVRMKNIYSKAKVKAEKEYEEEKEKSFFPPKTVDERIKRALYHDIIDISDEQIAPRKEFVGDDREYNSYLTEEILKSVADKIDYVTKNRCSINLYNEYYCFHTHYDFKMIEKNGIPSLLCYTDSKMESNFFIIDNKPFSDVYYQYENNYNDIMKKVSRYFNDEEMEKMREYQASFEKTKPNNFASSIDDEYTKLYFSIDDDKFEPFFKELGQEMIENNIECFTKGRKRKSNDQITLRIYDDKDFDRIYAIAKKYKNDVKQQPFMPVTEDGIGITYDRGDSYNDFMTLLLMDYFATAKDVNLTSFLSFVKERSAESSIKGYMYRNLSLALNKETADINDIKKISVDEARAKEISGLERELGNKTYNYLTYLSDYIVSSYCQYGKDYTSKLYEAALNYDRDKVIYRSSNGIEFTKGDLLDNYAFQIQKKQKESLEEQMEELSNLDEQYRKEYEEKGYAGISEVTKTNKNYHFSSELQPLFAKSKGITLMYRKNGILDTRKYNLALEKSYQEEAKVKVKTI